MSGPDVTKAQNLDDRFSEAQDQEAKFVPGWSESDRAWRRHVRRPTIRKPKPISRRWSTIREETMKNLQPVNILTDSNRMFALGVFDVFQMDETESVADQAYYILQILASVAMFRKTPIDEQEVIKVIIEKLPESWEDYAQSLRHEQKELSFEALITRLREEEEARDQKVGEKDDFWKYIPLYQAALRGDWATAETIFTVNQDSLTAKINEYEETALHVAAGAGRSSKAIDFVKRLVDKMSTEAVKLRDQANCTPLHLAAWAGNKEAAKVLLKKQPSLLYIRDSTNFSALDMAARNAKKDTLVYLLATIKDDDFSKLFPDGDSTAHFLILVITSGYYDIALHLVGKYDSLATATKKENGDCGLKALARKVSAFKSGSRHKWWQRVIYALIPVKLDDDSGELVMKEETRSHIGGDIENGAVHEPQVQRQKYNQARLLVECFCTFVAVLPCIKKIQDQKKMHLQALELLKRLCEGIKSLNDSDAYNLHAKDALLTAAKLGIHEVMEEIVESFPNLLWAKNKEKLNLFQIAVKERHADVFNLIYQMGDYQEILVQIRDDSGNNLLHLAGRLGPEKNNLVSGAALRMQHELQWFEEVKKFANPEDIDQRNKDDDTPGMLFTKDHEKLRVEGEKWMKETANSCTIPAALIVTVVFAATITVPGGINDDGLPIFSKEVIFNIFAIFNAISLFASITSLSLSLSILTSRYAEHDFLFALPNRLIISLATLFLSITTMVVAFSSALYLMFGNKDTAWIVCPVVAVASIPIFSFATLQFPLLLDLMAST